MSERPLKPTAWRHNVRVDGDKRRLMVASLRYLDTFAKIGGAWLFFGRRLYVDWVDERPIVVMAVLTEWRPEALSSSAQPTKSLFKGALRSREPVRRRESRHCQLQAVCSGRNTSVRLSRSAAPYESRGRLAPRRHECPRRSCG